MVSIPAGDRGLLSRLAGGLAWNLVGTGFNQGSTFVVNVLLAHLWGLQLFGEYAIVYTTLLAASAVAQLSMGYTATKYLAETRISDPARAGRVLALTGSFALAAAIGAAVLLLLGAPWIAGSILARPALVPAIRIAALAVAFSVVVGFEIGALAGLEAFRRLAMSGIATGFFFVAACGLGAFWAGLNGALWGLAAAGCFQLLLLLWQLAREMSRQGIRLTPRGAKSEFGLIARFSLPASIGGVISMTAFWLANAVLARQPAGYEAMALFAAANNFRLVVLFLPVIVNPVGMSLLNAHRGAQDESRYRQVFWLNLGLTLALVLLAVAVVLLLGPWLLGIFGKGYVAGYPILSVLMVAALAEAGVVAIYQLVQSQARIWLSLFAVVLPRDLTILGLSYALSPRLGAVGLAAAYAAGWCLALAAVIVLVRRHGLRLSPSTEPTRSVISDGRGELGTL